MARFDRQIATALKLIKKNGVAVKWRTVNDATPPDPLKPWIPGSATPVDNDVFVCFLPADLQAQKTFMLINGGEVPKGLQKGLMGAVPFEPNLKDVVIRDGKELRIVDIELLAPNSQEILHTVLFQQ